MSEGEIDRQDLLEWKDILLDVNGVGTVNFPSDGQAVMRVKYLKGGEPKLAQEILETIMDDLDLSVMTYERTWTQIQLILAPSDYWHIPKQWDDGGPEEPRGLRLQVREMEDAPGEGVPREDLIAVAGERRFEEAKKAGEVYVVDDQVKVADMGVDHD